MEIFQLTLDQMLTMFIFIIFGYLLRKTNILPESSSVTLSKLETYFLLPVLNFYAWMSNCTISTIKENSVLIFYGAGLILVAVAVSFPLSRLFVRKADTPALDYQRNIYKYALAFGNYGSMGNYIVLGIWGAEAFFRYSMFTFGISLISSTWGIFILIPKSEGEKQTLSVILKRIFTPPVVALLAGMLAGLLQIKDYIPTAFMTVLSDGSACMGPINMLLAGVVIGGFDLKELLTRKKIYAVTFLRLIAIPAVVIALLSIMGASKEIIPLAFIAFATPIGLGTVVYPAAYGGDVKTGASMTMISHTLSVITIPLMYLLL